MNHINNLSNYTIFLINDIIEYVSDSIDLKLSKVEVKIRDVLDFSYNVLKTLVECNESKVNNIETMMIIGENVDDVKIISDENRLKQIILNLVSNSFKFTKSGFIKILAKFNPELNYVEIRVEDSGMGIKRMIII